MPTISVFYGIIIQMFWDEHAPPHFHATYGEYEFRGHNIYVRPGKARNQAGDNPGT
jgi:hypothetical protein